MNGVRRGGGPRGARREPDITALLIGHRHWSPSDSRTPIVQGVGVVNSKLRNVPTTLGNDWPLRSPGNARPEQFFTR